MSRTLMHTPLPWRYAGENANGIHIANDLDVANSLHLTVAIVPSLSQEGRANAALIVRAINNHHALVEALRAIVHDPHGGIDPAKIAAARAALSKVED